MQVPDLWGVGAKQGMGFLCGLLTIGRDSLCDAKNKTDLFPTTGKQCTINCPGKWKSISRGAGRRIPYQWTLPWKIALFHIVSLPVLELLM
jgi:hypothetical protein